MNTISQSCLPEGILFHYHYEIDNFQANYPGCTEIDGVVLIGPGGYIYNLDGLSVLTRIGGDLRLRMNGSLHDIDALSGLNYKGGDLSVESSSLHDLARLQQPGSDCATSFRNQH